MTDDKLPLEYFTDAEWVEYQPGSDDPIPSPKNEPGTAALIAITVIAEVLGKLLGGLGGGSQKMALAVSNYSSNRLENPKVCICDGNFSDLEVSIPPEHVGFSTFMSRVGTYGTSGVITYDIKGYKRRFAIMWSNPALKKKSWFKFGIIKKAKIPTDKTLFKDMYYDRHDLVDGDCRQAIVGSMRWHNDDYYYVGTMGSAAQSAMKIEFHPRS